MPAPQPASPAPIPKPAPTQPAAPKGYVVQLGVFSNPDNALELQKKLTAAGIKSYTETRVHVGPFSSKAEADQAQAKLKALGLQPVVTPR